MKLIKIIAQLNPFSTEKTFFEFESDTVINILKKIDSNRAVNTGWRVMLNDQIVTDFETVVPEGASLYVKLVPEGDSAGETASKIGVWGGVAAMIAGTVLLFIPGLQLAGGIILGVGCGMFTSAGVVYLNYQQQKLLDQEKPEADPSIRGSRNQSRPMQSIPTLFGKRRIYPDLIMNPYTEVDSSGNQYLCQLFCAGQKDQEIDTSSIKIEETLLKDYSETKNINTILNGNDDHIKIKVHYGDSALTYFTKCVHEKQFNSILENKLEDDTSGAVIWTTPAGTTEINCDIFFYNGLGKYNDKGEIQSTSVEVKAYYKQKNEADSAYKLLGYFNNGSNTISGRQLKTLRYVVSKSGLSADSYTVKIERTTADSESSSVVDTVYLGSIRAKKNTSPVRSEILKKLCVIELKVKATPKLQNIIEQLNFVSQSKMPIYSGSGTGKNSWSTNALTSNPASCALMAMQGEFAQQKLKETDIDWLSFEKLYNWCQTHNYECNYYLTESQTISQLLSNIATCSRSEIFRLNGKITVVQDIERDSPVQLFTPRNSKNYTETLLKTEIPDCLILKFVNKDSGFAEDEVNVYNTISGNKETEPEITQEVNLWGITSSEQARKVGLYDLAVFRARSVVHTFQVDFEYMLCTKGDWIKYAGDIALAGLKQGRIQKLLFDNSNKIVGFVSDELLPMEQANNYAVRIRKNDGEIVLCDLAYFQGNHLEVYFVDSYNADEFQEQNLFAFGIRGQETIDLIVTNISCQDNLTAEITAVEYAPAIFEVDSPNFVLPDFESKISDVPGVVDSGAVDLSDWRTFYTYNDSEAQPAKPTGNGTENGWHRNSTAQSKWVSSKTAKDINSGEWSAPSPTGSFIFDKLLSDEPTIDNPDAPEFLTAFAEENGIKISCSTKEGIKNSISKYIFEINKGSVWIQKTSQSSEFLYNFDRNSDGYPEGTDLSKWKIRAKVESVYGKESDYSSEIFVNVDTYGTWQVQQPEVIVSSNKRLISLNLTQGKRADAKQVYGAIGYKILVNRPDIDDEDFFTPATNKNPSVSELNYKNDTTEPIVVGTTYIQELPLKGQNAKKWKFKYYETRKSSTDSLKDSVSYLDNLDSVFIPDNAEKTETYIYWTETTDDLTQHFEYSLVDMPSPEETYYRFKIVAVNLKAGNESAELIIGTYARANSASDLVDNAITQNALAPDAVTADKIAAGTISAEKLAAEDILAKGARAGMVSTEGLQVDNAGFFASKPFVYNYIDPLTQEEKTYVTKSGEFFVGNSPDIEDKREGISFFHFIKGLGFFIRIAEFAVRGLSTIIENIFRVKKAGESDLTALMVVNSTDSMDILSGTPARSSRINGLLKTNEFIAEKFIVQESGVNSLYVMLQDESFNHLRNVIVTKKNLKIIEESGWIWTSEHKGKFKADYFMGNLEPPIYHESYTSLYVGDRLYSFGDYGRAYNEIIYSDDDGDTWNIIATKWQYKISHAFYYEDYFYIVLSSGAVYKCNQDFTLTEQVIEIFDYTGYIVNLLFFSGYFYLFTSDKVYRTLDFSSLEIVLQGTFLNSELYKDIMIVYNHSEWFVSKDGSSWKAYTYIDSGLEYFSCLCATDKYIVAGTKLGNVYLSVDGINWTIIKTSLENKIAKIYFYENYLYLVVRLENEKFYTIYFLSVDNELLLIDDKNTTALNTWSSKKISEEFEKRFPVGIIIAFAIDVNPEEAIGGFWVRISDVFLLGAGNKYGGGDIGGREAVTLTENELPSHRHSIIHKHNTTVSSSSIWTRPSGSGSPSLNANTKTDYRGSSSNITVTVSANTSDTTPSSSASSKWSGYIGKGSAFSILPPYLGVYYWKRVAVKYKLVFDANGGIGEMLSILEEPQTVIIPANNFEREGYEFLSFNTAPDGSGTSYQPGDSIVLSEDITLYAIWEQLVSIPAGTYSPSAFKNLISQFITKNGNRTVKNEFTATVNNQTITVPANAKIYYNTSYSGVEQIGFNSTSTGILGSSFETYKHYIIYVEQSLGGMQNYVNYPITIGNIKFN